MNKTFKKSLVLALVFCMVVSVMALAGCGKKEEEKTDWDYIEGNGKIIVGLDDTFAPMGFRDKNDELVGFDIDLAKAVGEKLGVEMEFKSIDWDAKEMELEAKSIDCIWNGMSATPERNESMSLSKEYLNNQIVVMTESDKVKIAKVEDLKKYNIGTQVESAALETMQANESWDTFKDKVKEYKSYDDAILDMESGRLDCIVIDSVAGNYKNTQIGGKLKECEFNFGDDFYAIGFRKDDTELTGKVNDAIKECIDDGTAEKISKEWFGKNIVIFQDFAE